MEDKQVQVDHEPTEETLAELTGGRAEKPKEEDDDSQ